MFYDPADFPFTAGLEKQFAAIRREVEALPSNEFKPWPEKMMYENRWDVFVLYNFGRKLEGNCALCPETTRAIESVPGLTTAGFSLDGGGHVHQAAYRLYGYGAALPPRADRATGLRAARRRGNPFLAGRQDLDFRRYRRSRSLEPRQFTTSRPPAGFRESAGSDSSAAAMPFIHKRSSNPRRPPDAGALQLRWPPWEGGAPFFPACSGGL